MAMLVLRSELLLLTACDTGGFNAARCAVSSKGIIGTRSGERLKVDHLSRLISHLTAARDSDHKLMTWRITHISFRRVKL